MISDYYNLVNNYCYFDCCLGHSGKIFKFAVGMTIAMGLLEYLLFGAWKVVKSAYLQLKKEKEQDSDTQIIMNDQELV